MENGENTCGAHDDECNTWCKYCQMWECDRCASTCQEYHSIVRIKL